MENGGDFLEGRHSRYKIPKREEVKEHMKKIAIFAAIMVVGAGVALASTLNVPFFLDNQSNNAGTTGVVGRIGVKEAGGVNQTVTVIYTALNASGNPTDQIVTYALGANQAFRWNPVQNNSAEASGPGSGVPNMTIPSPNSTPGTVGAARIIGSAALSGNYSEIDLSRSSTSMHVLLPD